MLGQALGKRITYDASYGVLKGGAAHFRSQSRGNMSLVTMQGMDQAEYRVRSRDSYITIGGAFSEGGRSAGP